MRIDNTSISRLRGDNVLVVVRCAILIMCLGSLCSCVGGYILAHAMVPNDKPQMTMREKSFIKSDEPHRMRKFSALSFEKKLDMYILLYEWERKPNTWYAQEMAKESGFMDYAREKVQSDLLKQSRIAAIMDWLREYLRSHDASDITEVMRENVAVRLQTMYCIGYFTTDSYKDVDDKLGLSKYFRKPEELNLEIYKPRRRY